MSYQAFVVLTHFLLLSLAVTPHLVTSDSLHRATSGNSNSASAAIASSDATSSSDTKAAHLQTATIDATNRDTSASAEAAAAAGAGASAGGVLPPVGGVVPPIGGVVPPILPGAGAGLGFHKNVDFNIGKGIGLLPFLSGIIPGIGPAPVVPPVVATPPVVPDPDPIVPPVGGLPGLPGIGGLGLDSLAGLLPPGGYLGLPFLGPSYIPQTWVGSALGAKGDLLFPIVIFVFAIVGVWAVAHFLLSLIVPLIASKFLLIKGVAAKKSLRATPEEENPKDHRQSIIDSLTHTVTSALAEEKCIKLITCQTGNFMRSITGNDRAMQIATIVKNLNSTSEAMKVFQHAAENGEDCSQFACFGLSPSNFSSSPPEDSNHRPLATNLPIQLHSHDNITTNDLGEMEATQSTNASANDLSHKHPLLSAFRASTS